MAGPTGSCAAWAAAELAEHCPALEDREAALGVGADRGMAAVGLPGGVRQVPSLVRGEQGGSFSTDIALVSVEVEPGGRGGNEGHVVASGGEVVGGAGGPSEIQIGWPCGSVSPCRLTPWWRCWPEWYSRLWARIEDLRVSLRMLEAASPSSDGQPHRRWW